jgi:hypothetical protein
MTRTRDYPRDLGLPNHRPAGRSSGRSPPGEGLTCIAPSPYLGAIQIFGFRKAGARLALVLSTSGGEQVLQRMARPAGARASGVRQRWQRDVGSPGDPIVMMQHERLLRGPAAQAERELSPPPAADDARNKQPRSPKKAGGGSVSAGLLASNNAPLSMGGGML